MELTDALFDLCKSSKRPIIAIDGPAGAGKTTLAEHLSAALSLKYKCATLHMDDLYNGWQHPFDHHLRDALIEACTAHQGGKKLSLPLYNWSKGDFNSAEEIPTGELLILEGVGSSQRDVRPYLDVAIWIDIDPDKGLLRVLHRDGDAIAPQMQSWLSKQEQHFRENDSQKAADFEVSN